MPDRRLHLKVKIKSLAAEARIIRHEERKLKGFGHGASESFSSLRTHRIREVRQEARASQLAYACMRDVPLKALEANPKTKPNWTQVEKILYRFTRMYDSGHVFESDMNVAKERLRIWKKG